MHKKDPISMDVHMGEGTLEAARNNETDEINRWTKRKERVGNKSNNIFL